MKALLQIAGLMLGALSPMLLVEITPASLALSIGAVVLAAAFLILSTFYGREPLQGQWYANGCVRRTALYIGVHWSIGGFGRRFNIPVNEARLRAYDRRRRLAAPLAGLTFFQKSDRGVLLIARHWPHRLCWDWFLEWNRPRLDRGEYHPLALAIGNRWHEKFRLGLWFGSLTFVKQPYGYVLRDYGPDPAPRAVYEHDVKHEAGHA